MGQTSDPNSLPIPDAARWRSSRNSQSSSPSSIRRASSSSSGIATGAACSSDIVLGGVGRGDTCGDTCFPCPSIMIRGPMASASQFVSQIPSYPACRSAVSAVTDNRSEAMKTGRALSSDTLLTWCRSWRRARSRYLVTGRSGEGSVLARWRRVTEKRASMR